MGTYSNLHGWLVKNLVVLVAIAGTWFGLTEIAQAQVTLQLPTVSVFEIRTVVSVPDGGTMYLGGINRSFSGSTSRGVPMLSNVPGAGRLFKNRGIGRETSGGGVSVSVTILSQREMEAELMREAEARQRARQATDPNGPVDVQRRADFISRNIGRRRK